MIDKNGYLKGPLLDEMYTRIEVGLLEILRLEKENANNPERLKKELCELYGLSEDEVQVKEQNGVKGSWEFTLLPNSVTYYFYLGERGGGNAPPD